MEFWINLLVAILLAEGVFVMIGWGATKFIRPLLPHWWQTNICDEAPEYFR